MAAEEFSGGTSNIGNDRSANCKPGWMEPFPGLVTWLFRRLLQWTWTWLCAAVLKPACTNAVHCRRLQINNMSHSDVLQTCVEYFKFA